MLYDKMDLFSFQICILILFIAKETKSDSEICQFRDSCVFNNNGNSSACKCGDDCYKREICCNDYFKTNLRRLPLNSPLFLESCMSEKNNKMLGNEIEQISEYLIDTCCETKESCNVSTSDSRSFIPVSHNGTTYLNADCATCNNVENFKPWGLVSLIQDLDDLVHINWESGTYSNLNESYVAEQMLDPKITSTLYYLLPPHDFKPRECPVESWDTTPFYNVHERYSKNLSSCNTALFKNYNFCIDNQCCAYKLGECTILNSTGGQIGDPGKLLQSNIRVFFDFNGDASTSSKGQLHIRDQTKSIEFQGVGVTILMDVRMGINTSLAFKDCINGIIAYLKTTHFKLVPKHGYYVQYFKAEEYLFTAELESPLKLSPSKVNDLLTFRSSIGYMEMSSQNQAIILLSALRDPGLIMSLRSDRKKNVAVDRTIHSLPTMSEPCMNINLVLVESNNETTMDI